MKLHFDSVKGNFKKCNIMANIFRKSTQDKMILVRTIIILSSIRVCC